MGAALLAGSFGLLTLPTLIRRLALRSRDATRLAMFSLITGSVLLEAGFIACAIALCAVCTEALLGHQHGHFFPGGRLAGLVSLALAVLFPLGVATGLRRARRRTRNMELEPWVGRHFRRQDHEVVVLPTSAMVAFSNGGANAQIVVSRGLLQTLSPDAVDAVLAHEAAHLRLQHRRYLLPVAALEPIAAVVPPLRSSLAATRFAIERWADEEAIPLGGTRSGLKSALGLLSTTPPVTPLASFNGQNVEGRLRALEDYPQPSAAQTAVVLAGLALCSLVSVVALVAWL